MVISNSIPIQFWLTGQTSFNQMELVGVQRHCFCQPLQCADSQKIVFYDTVSRPYQLQIFDANGGLLTTLDFTETIDDSLFIYTYDLANLNTYCNQNISMAIVYDDTTTTTTTTSTTTTVLTTTTTTIEPDPETATLTFTQYAGGDFIFDLSVPIPSTNVVVTVADVTGSEIAGCALADESDTLAGPLTIVAGTTNGNASGTTPMTCDIATYLKVNSIVVNGLTKTSGQTITIGGTLVTISIGGCAGYPC